MTLLGKVFTLLILVMSVVFMSFAVVVYATHVNWKEVVTDPATGLKRKVADWEDKVKQLQSELQKSKNALAREQAARRFVIAALRTKLEAADVELKAKVTDFENEQAKSADLAQSNQTISTTLDSLTKEVGTLRVNINNAIDDRNRQFEEVVTLTDSLNRLEGTRATLDERYRQLIAENSRARGLLESAGMTLADPIPDEAPMVDGVVTQVGEHNLIEISLGQDDGIRVGHQLFVFRGNIYLGRVVVKRTTADFAVAEIIREPNKSVLIRKDDRVATKLS